VLQSVLDILYPVRCPICCDIVTPKDRKICIACEKNLHFISEPRCKKCSKPIEHEQREYCSDCERKSFGYEHGFSVWVYDAAIKKSISDFKYRHKKEYAKYFIHEVVKGTGIRS